MSGPFWAGYARDVWIPQIAVLRETVFDRMISAFADISAEAGDIENEVWERLGSMAGPDTDPGDLAEAALDAGAEYYLMRADAQQALLNLFGVAIHHLVEQQLLVLLRKQLLPMAQENDAKLFKRSVVQSELAKRGIDLATFPEWPGMEELRHVANTVKHADGDSATELAALRPHLFDRPTFRGTDLARGPVGQVFTPLAGDELFLSEQDLASYFDCATAFWHRLADALEAIS